MFELNAVPKPYFKRNKPTAGQRGAISPKVRKALKERSNEICERCRSARAVHAAHLVRRWQLERTTVDLLAHLCLRCHVDCDSSKTGRAWLESFRTLLSGSGLSVESESENKII